MNSLDVFSARFSATVNQISRIISIQHCEQECDFGIEDLDLWLEQTLHDSLTANDWLSSDLHVAGEPIWA